MACQKILKLGEQLFFGSMCWPMVVAVCIFGNACLGTSELATIASHRRAYGLIGGVEQSISHKYALIP